MGLYHCRVAINQSRCSCGDGESNPLLETDVFDSAKDSHALATCDQIVDMLCIYICLYENKLFYIEDSTFRDVKDNFDFNSQRNHITLLIN